MVARRKPHADLEPVPPQRRLPESVKSSALEAPPLAVIRSANHARRWQSRGNVRSFGLPNGDRAVALVGPGIAAGLFVSRGGFEWLRFRIDEAYSNDVVDAAAWPAFWAWLATAPRSARPNTVGYELLPLDPSEVVESDGDVSNG